MRARSVVVALLLLAATATAAAQNSLEAERRRGQQMLAQVADDLRTLYFDPALRGVDLDALVRTTSARIDQAGSIGEILTEIAKVPLALGDSHTRFLPPARVHDVDYGWSWRFVGDRAIVDAVDKGSDAWKQGLRPGDAVVEVFGFTLSRQTSETIRYVIKMLRPQPQLKVVLERNGVRESLVFAADVKERRQKYDLDNGLDRYALQMQWAMKAYEAPRPRQEWLAEGVLYWRLPSFSQGWWEISQQFGNFRKARVVVLDLRGNGGGRLSQMLTLLAAVHDRAVTVGTLVTRKDQVPVEVSATKAAFLGELLVLVDGESGSASELFARAIQLEKRGRVVGDRTAGLVTGAIVREHAAGDGKYQTLYATMVAVSDIVMSDGQRLERIGVTPDIVLLPTPADIREGRDPVLTHAAGLVGVTLDPARAARLSR